MNIEAIPIFAKICAPSAFSFHPAPILYVSEYPSMSCLQHSVPSFVSFLRSCLQSFFSAPLTVFLHSLSQLWAALQVPSALPTSPGLGQVPELCLDTLCSLDVSTLGSQPVYVVAWRVLNRSDNLVKIINWHLRGSGPLPLAWHLHYPSVCHLGELIPAE